MLNQTVMAYLLVQSVAWELLGPDHTEAFWGEEVDREMGRGCGDQYTVEMFRLIKNHDSSSDSPRRILTV